MFRGLALALLIAAAPSLARAQVYGSPTFTTVKVGGANGQTITGVGTAPGTVAAGNDPRIVGATQNASAAITGGTINGAAIGGTTPAAGTFTTLAANGLTLGTPLPISQGGCGATTALGCLTNLGLAGGTAGYVLTSNGPGTAPSYQAATGGSGSAVLYTPQSLTSGQQDQVRANIGGAVPSAPSASATLATTDIDRPFFPTGTITLTVPNGGAGWRTGTVKNANLVTGLVTLAVPSGATLDGTTNGTTILFPYQRARIVQTGATSYATDWVEQAPIVATVSITSGVANTNINLPAGYTSFRIAVKNVVMGTNGAFLAMRTSDNGTANIKSGGSDYFYSNLYGASGTAAATYGSTSYYDIASNVNDSGGSLRTISNITFNPGGTGQQSSFIATTILRDNSPQIVTYLKSGDYTGATSGALGRINLIQFLATTGTFTGNITVWGEP